jgi:hypothetical protein
MGCIGGNLAPACSRLSTPPRGLRAMAWRNLMCAGINTGLELGLFSLEPDTVDEQVYPFLFPGGIPAVAHVREIDRGELAIHAALWPTGQFIRCYNGGFHAGAAFAAGWLERREGTWLQTSRRRMFTCKPELLPVVAGAAIEPVGYADHGRLM